MCTGGAAAAPKVPSSSGENAPTVRWRTRAKTAVARPERDRLWSKGVREPGRCTIPEQSSCDSVRRRARAIVLPAECA